MEDREHGFDVTRLGVVGCAENRQLALGHTVPFDGPRQHGRHDLEGLGSRTQESGLGGVPNGEDIVAVEVNRGDGAAV